MSPVRGTVLGVCTKGVGMKLRVTRKLLSESLSWVLQSAFPHSASAAERPVQLAARTDGSVTVGAFSEHLSAVKTISAEAIEPSAIVVDGVVLADLCRRFTEADLDLVVDNGQLLIASGSAYFTLPLIAEAITPQRPQVPAALGMVNPQLWHQAVQQVAPVAHRATQIPALAGVQVRCSPDALELAATDQYRIAVRQIPWRFAGFGTQEPFVVPAQSLRIMSAAMKDVDHDVALAMSPEPSEAAGGVVGLATTGQLATAHLLAVDFPKVRRLFPDDYPTFVVLERTELIKAVELVSVVASGGVAVRLTFIGDDVLLEVGDVGAAQAQQRIWGELVGEPLSVAFNPQYLLDGLRALRQPFVRMSFTDPQQPAVLTGQPAADGADEPDFEYLLMSIRLGAS